MLVSISILNSDDEVASEGVMNTSDDVEERQDGLHDSQYLKLRMSVWSYIAVIRLPMAYNTCDMVSTPFMYPKRGPLETW